MGFHLALQVRRRVTLLCKVYAKLAAVQNGTDVAVFRPFTTDS